MPQDEKYPARISLDLARLVAENTLTPQQADELLAMSAPNKSSSILANIILVFGALAVVTGILALSPSLTTGLVLALLSLSGGAALVFFKPDEWGFLGQTFALMGTLGLAGWTALNFEEMGGLWPQYSAITIAVLVTTATIIFRNAVLAVVTPLSWGAVLGSGTSYWHASYGLFVQEATISIFVFLVAALALHFGLKFAPKTYHFIMRMAARTCIFMVNFAFWVGSLWGDRPGEIWLRPDGDWAVRNEWRDAAFFIPDYYFSIGWAMVLAIGIWWGVTRNNRFVSNVCLVFLSIHFYTQLFEVLIEEGAFALVVAGVSAIAIATGIFKFDQWQQKQAK